MQTTNSIKNHNFSYDVQQHKNVQQQLKRNKYEFKTKQIDADIYCERLLGLLKQINTPSKQKHMSLKEHMPYIYNSYLCLSDDKITSLYQYYKRMINDSLDLIRKGQTAYLYTEEQIKDTLRFEPDIQIKYESDACAFCISL